MFSVWQKKRTDAEDDEIKDIPNILLIHNFFFELQKVFCNEHIYETKKSIYNGEKKKLIKK